jgi:SAM-dependent methyltransferase
LDDIKEGFPLALDIGMQTIYLLFYDDVRDFYNLSTSFFTYFAGAGPGYIHRAICMDDAFHGEGGIGGVRKLVQVDSSEEMLHRDEGIPVEGAHRCDSYRMHADEEGKLPFPNGTFDLVLSSQSMHWVNDLPGLFKEVQVGWKVAM